MWVTLRHFVDAKDFGDIVIVEDETWQKSESEIFDARNFYLKGINHDYAVTTQISVAISKLQALFGVLRVSVHYNEINSYQLSVSCK
jgi:hypothetical protein